MQVEKKSGSYFLFFARRKALPHTKQAFHPKQDRLSRIHGISDRHYFRTSPFFDFFYATFSEPAFVALLPTEVTDACRQRVPAVSRRSNSTKDEEKSGVCMICTVLVHCVGSAMTGAALVVEILLFQKKKKKVSQRERIFSPRGRSLRAGGSNTTTS